MFKHTTERGSVAELLVMEEGLDVFWESRVEGGGDETVVFNVSSSLRSRQNKRGKSVNK